ncbi:hypothetical protein D3C85_225520 [compost metagenome]
MEDVIELSWLIEIHDPVTIYGTGSLVRIDQAFSALMKCPVLAVIVRVRLRVIIDPLEDTTEKLTQDVITRSYAWRAIQLRLELLRSPATGVFYLIPNVVRGKRAKHATGHLSAVNAHLGTFIQRLVKLKTLTEHIGGVLFNTTEELLG